MKAEIGGYFIKWVIIAPFSAKKGFNRNYKSALKRAGFKEIACYGIFACHYNSKDKASVARIEMQIKALRAKIDSYAHPKALFSFTITDKQFGMIGTERALTLSQKKGWIQLPLDAACGVVIPATYNQMYSTSHGAILLRGSQVR